jgi:NAD(P)-dependent dehydrogenase (short-subunit alcohol dehydrogenase family)
VLEGWDRLDLVIYNAGHHGRERTSTKDGFETTLAVSRIAHALLLRLLEQRIRETAPSTVVIVASEAYGRARDGLDFDDLTMERGPFKSQLAYNRSKLANILYARELSKQ